MNPQIPWPLLVLLGCILIAQGTWVFLDARKRGENYWLWGLFGLMSTPLNPLIYLLVTRYRKIKCPDCGRFIYKNNERCPYCSGATRTCSRCGEEVQIGWGYCPHCSNKLK